MGDETKGHITLSVYVIDVNEGVNIIITFQLCLIEGVLYRKQKGTIHLPSFSWC